MIQILQELAPLSQLNHIHSVVIITNFLQKCDAKGSVIFYQEGAPENWGGSGTLSNIKRGDQKIFSN